MTHSELGRDFLAGVRSESPSTSDILLLHYDCMSTGVEVELGRCGSSGAKCGVHGPFGATAVV